ncbi:MAG TPA: cytochrome c-type biogenesis protein CcmH [Bryobacteraceae bacterium]|nr:cytochrome c-type biogenesis protein CcmH [Bryobacteraceae bacterium]
MNFRSLIRRSGRSLLFLVLAGAAFAQSESQIESDEVKRVGSHINCQCGCKDNLNCMMSGGQCHFCKPNRAKIFKMQQDGMDDASIIGSFKKEFGDLIYRPDPTSMFWIVPYLSFGAGALLVALVLMKMRSHARHHEMIPAAAGGHSPGASPEADDAFTRYRAAIEKDTERLD